MYSVITSYSIHYTKLYDTPRGGGLAIVVVWYTFLTFAFFAGHMPTQLYLALMSSIVLAGVSFIDDIRNLSPRIRLASQLVSAVLALYFLGGLQSIDLGFTILKLPVWTNILVVVAILWAINLFNFLDGIDGYLGMEGVFVFVTLFLFTHDFNTLAFAAVIAGFLVWNWPKAKIFCGDIGVITSYSIHYTKLYDDYFFQKGQHGIAR